MLFKNRKNTKKFNFKERLPAFTVHLSISIIIFVIFLWIMLKYWFPTPHFQINGGWQGIKIIIPIDLIIGPCLTFLLFNPRKAKRVLIFDLLIIAFIQISLLIYGIDKINSQRPFVQVISHRGYIASTLKKDLIYQVDVKPDKYITALNNYSVYPPIVYSVYEDYKTRSRGNLFKDMFTIKKDESLKGNFNPEMIVSRYRSLNSLETQNDLKKAANKAMERFNFEPDNKKAIEDYKDKYGSNFYFFPLRGQYGDAIMVLEKTGKPIDYFNIKLFDE